MQYAASGEDASDLSDGGASEDVPGAASQPDVSDSEADISLDEDDEGNIVAKAAVPSSSRQAARAASRAAADAAKVQRVAKAMARQAKAKPAAQKPARKAPAARPRAVPRLVKQHKASVWSDSDDESQEDGAPGASTRHIDFRHLQLKEDHNSRCAGRSRHPCHHMFSCIRHVVHSLQQAFRFRHPPRNHVLVRRSLARLSL